MSKELGIELLEEIDVIKESISTEKRPRSASKRVQLPYHNKKKIKTEFFPEDNGS
jgi:hypothetical protein